MNDADKTRGLYHKFNIARTDGSSGPGGKHEDCRYYVLDLDHDPHAKAAIRAYADSCRSDYPELAADLGRLFPNDGIEALVSPSPPVTGSDPTVCQLCGVRGWIDSSPAWGNRCICRACKGTFMTNKLNKTPPWMTDEQYIQRLEQFMNDVAKLLNCLPSYSDPHPDSGNTHIMMKLRGIIEKNKSPTMNLVDYVNRQREWSERTFGRGARVNGITRHIEKELGEIRADPNDLSEWVDVVILALDGAWRAGYSPTDIATALERKQAVNFSRQWPPASDCDPYQPSEHIR